MIRSRELFLMAMLAATAACSSDPGDSGERCNEGKCDDTDEEDAFFCPDNKTQVLEHQLCDGVSDCPDGWDEEQDDC
jgi:hypothetical protein